MGVWLACVGLAGCGPSEDDDPGSDSGGSSESDGSSGAPATEDGEGAPAEEGGCPSDMDLLTTAPKSEAVEGLDEDTLEDDPRFVESFCASYCPDAPDGYLPSYCAPVDVGDVIPSDDTTGGDTGDELIDVRCHYWPGCM